MNQTEIAAILVEFHSARKRRLLHFSTILRRIVHFEIKAEHLSCDSRNGQAEVVSGIIFLTLQPTLPRLNISHAVQFYCIARSDEKPERFRCVGLGMTLRQKQRIKVKKQFDTIGLPGRTLSGGSGIGRIQNFRFKDDMSPVPVDLPGNILHLEFFPNKLIFHYFQRIMEKMPAEVENKFRLLALPDADGKLKQPPAVGRHRKPNRPLRNQAAAMQSGGAMKFPI